MSAAFYTQQVDVFQTGNKHSLATQHLLLAAKRQHAYNHGRSNLHRRNSACMRTQVQDVFGLLTACPKPWVRQPARSHRHNSACTRKRERGVVFKSGVFKQTSCFPVQPSMSSIPSSS
jgi:hypothetical protein